MGITFGLQFWATVAKFHPERGPKIGSKSLFFNYLAENVEDMAGEPGFEPGLTESESVGLPLTYSPKAGFRGIGFVRTRDGERLINKRSAGANTQGEFFFRCRLPTHREKQVGENEGRCYNSFNETETCLLQLVRDFARRNGH